MVQRKILVLLGAEDKETTAGMLADAYERGALYAKHELKRLNIGDLKFDPLLHKGYKVIQPLEPDLVEFQNKISWCDHFVIIYPNWWSCMPAALKGLFDRSWLPGFAFRFRKNKGYMWDKLLKGKSARVIITMNAVPLIERVANGDYTNEIRRGILKFAGFSPVRLWSVGPVERANESQKKNWIRKVEQMGRDAD